MSLTALDTDVKGSDSILLDKLVADGAVDKTKAASLGAFFRRRGRIQHRCGEHLGGVQDGYGYEHQGKR